ncbi:unnamed protein product [Linum trigynum]|uniref:Uncharacterized protein n=1 Tax=Linum trigynum TaxID=586398 RepID=A0AAV2CBS4_9ROSI
MDKGAKKQVWERQEGTATAGTIKGKFPSLEEFCSNNQSLRKGAAKNVKNGKKTNFWRDVWVLQEPLITKALLDIPEETQERTVAYYWSDATGWKIEDLVEYLPDEILNRIRVVMLDPLDTTEGVLFCKASPNGLFTTSSA